MDTRTGQACAVARVPPATLVAVRKMEKAKSSKGGQRTRAGSLDTANNSSSKCGEEASRDEESLGLGLMLEELGERLLDLESRIRSQGANEARQRDSDEFGKLSN